ncbi:hypothetical protein [Tomitella fengzijianii]|uniref:hypothetical protein n=1 Tax=Tomitella fengzijianii TaxID=2597660 RepID=UPI00131BABCC|nr:hypothetical protein [Tomitella fengzijianii]
MSFKRTPADGSLSSLSGGSGGSTGELGSSQIAELGGMLETVGQMLQKLATGS